MKRPGLGHPITVTLNPKRVSVTVAGKAVAETPHALTFKEASYPAVRYIPREDTDMSVLERTSGALLDGLTN
jgi:uncharacterized protein (DUF427 family)